MAHIPLVEHTRPCVLMLDFPPQDVTKVQQAGFDARRGATGLHDHNEFFLPFAVQDVDIVFAHVQNGSFSEGARTAAKNSVHEAPFFRDLMRETWKKAGWIVLFVGQNTSPKELNLIGLERVGIIPYERRHIPESIRKFLIASIKEQQRYYEEYDTPTLPSPQIPRFVGQVIHTSDEPEMMVVERYIKNANMSILTCLKHPVEDYYKFQHITQPFFSIFDEVVSIDPLIQDNSTDENILALKVDNSVRDGSEGKKVTYNKGRILLLPDFGKNNGNVALALLQETIPQISAHLFDTPQHPWLEDYQPATILHLEAERALVIADAHQKLEQLDAQIEVEREKYDWLPSLLVSTGDEFASTAAQSLRFLGFDVEEVDNTLVSNERRREDLHIRDAATDYFALGEAKTTGKGRGASEEFISKTQTHQMRYARENTQVPPRALLLMNYAIDLNPAHRAARFYQPEVAGRLEDSSITAINSVALFELCQAVLNQQLSKKQVRQFITLGQPFINTITPEQVIETINLQ